MTGAPKKRSVRVLRDLEGEERGIYSGVLGYADVGGGGDWAVIIRSCFKHDDHPSSARSNDETNVAATSDDSQGESVVGDAASEASSTETGFDEWTLGAGGAITALSDPVAEWEEMVTKVESVLRAFNSPTL
ncbi:hypothetical protein NUW54_g8993 [Trametes sanguinea]|uniref:Uncharacterized protein n=1 Tax=Trametes sanguinea TaxID=158606 RepID=A0ACC1PBQ3_9APHY|nr:hypothetical protein NUW54_g8993 [Trametes sanguinea]